MILTVSRIGALHRLLTKQLGHNQLTAEAKLFWSVQEAAAYIPVSPLTMYDWLREGRGIKPRAGASKLRGKPMPYRQFGRNKILIPIEEFKKWVEDLNNNPQR